MPRIPFFRLGPVAADLEPPRLSSYTPSLSLEGLQVGVDNLRYDVHLSPRFVEQARLQMARLLSRHGQVEGLLAAEAAETAAKPQANYFVGAAPAPKKPAPAETTDLKALLAGLEIAALNRAKAMGTLSADLLARLAILKFFRAELQTQFGQILERCRILVKGYDVIRQQKAIEYRERVSAFQVGKKIILRKAGQDLFRMMREIEKETLASTRRSLFGNRAEAEYQLFLNPLIFTEDGRDIYLNAEQYVLLGNFDRDPDRFANLRRIVSEFLKLLNLGAAADDDATRDGWLCVPENAHVLVGAGRPDETTHGGKAQKERLVLWTEMLENEGVLEYAVASYEVIPLLAEYSPRINAQQLKQALLSREERNRVEKLIEEHGSLSAEPLYAAAARVTNRRTPERTMIAGRFLYDFLRYHRDLRRLETVNAALDSVNLIGNPKLRELSAMNGTLYEFVLANEQKPAEEKVLRHVVLKADVRDSTRLTRCLLEKGLNPASYFTMNFYDPVNKLLPKYGATKVFLEGDAIILALLEREGEVGFAVSRACALGREMIDIVQGYNQLLERAGLPSLEIGVGIAYQDSAPMYLLDEAQRIMISDALNESDRLSSCNKRMRKPMQELDTPFRVYVFQTGAGGDGEDFMNYNLNGVRMSEAAFQRLREEISLEPLLADFPELWGNEGFRLWQGLVPVGRDIFKPIVVRATRVGQINTSDFSLKSWSDRRYYEVCTHASVYAALGGKASAGA
jgi:hypothetical protein